MNPFEMVIAIVGIAALVSVIRAKRGERSGLMHRSFRRSFRAHHGDRTYAYDDSGSDSGDDLGRENQRLRDELNGLKQRIQVLERLATDDETDAARLDREIEKLRERPGLTASAQDKE